jgi:GR25 family glycosyltransferase involved in LPS biosynthesis
MATTISAPGYRVNYGAPRSPYRGVYINLDRSSDRRAAIEGQLSSLKVLDRYARFAAVDGEQIKSTAPGLKAGQAACFWSHYGALSSLRGTQSCIHVLEDDAVLSQYLPEAIEAEQQMGTLDRFDIVYTETFAGYNAYFLREFKELTDDLLSRGPKPAFTVMDISGAFMAGTTSYLVGARGLDRVLASYRKGLDAGPTLPIDLFIRQEASQGNLKIGCIFPFITTVRLEWDSIINSSEPDAERLSRLAATLLRYSFFVDRDFDNYAKPSLDLLADAMRRGSRDRHQEVLAQALGFVLSNNFRPF